MQGLNLDLLHCRQFLYCLSHQGSPIRETKAVSVSAWAAVCCTRLGQKVREDEEKGGKQGSDPEGRCGL